MNLDKVKMHVMKTADNGVVNHQTIFHFSQHGDLVTASYPGGKIQQGYLVGVMEQGKLSFSFCQLQNDGKHDNGQSECDVVDEDGNIKLYEYFEWASRPGEKGVNVFQQI